MACYHPLLAYMSPTPKSNGKKKIVFGDNAPANYEPVKLPCGRCIGCRLEYSRQWAMRIHHEASLYDQNSFVTLTYRDEDLPDTGTLVKEHFQLFMKRLRRRLNCGKNYKIRYFHCGEYGEDFGRPHYHAILFNLDFPDKVFFKKQFNGFDLYVSPFLDSVWQKGYCTIGAVTFDSAAYCARYVTKKVNGQLAEKVDENGLKHYEKLTSEGEIVEVSPEYATMSRNPGIAKDWYDSYKSDCYPSDTVHINGVEMRPPRYYDTQFEIDNPVLMSEIKEKRKEKAEIYAEHNTPDRLEVREKVQKAKLTKLVRSYEDN